jgi:hypothetical protein
MSGRFDELGIVDRGPLLSNSSPSIIRRRPDKHIPDSMFVVSISRADEKDREGGCSDLGKDTLHDTESTMDWW